MGCGKLFRVKQRLTRSETPPGIIGTVIRRNRNKNYTEERKMKKDLTELVFVLDRSGSMEHLTGDTIGGFNAVLKEHRNGEGEVLVTTYLFNDTASMIHDRLPAAEVKPMTEKDYCACGCTALMDALGTAIRHIAGIHRYAREEDIPEHTIFVITTDGMENASHSFSAEEVRKMVKHEQEKYGWEFLFLASNIDAVENAEHIGIRRENAVDCCPDAAGTEMLYNAASRAIGNIRGRKNLAGDTSWRNEADRDFHNRGK